MDLVKNVEDITQFLGELKSPVPEDLIPGMKPPKHDFSVGQVIHVFSRNLSYLTDVQSDQIKVVQQVL